MNTRRHWLAACMAMPTLTWMSALPAQTNPPVVIGFLSRQRASWAQQAFHEGMAALSWKLGTHYVLVERHTDGAAEPLPVLAQEVASAKPAVIVAQASTLARAAAAAAPTTPVVLFNGDPLATGLVTSLARPGGLITGISNVSSITREKVIELMVEAMPKLRRIGFLVDTTSPVHGATVMAARQAAERFGLQAFFAYAARPEELDPAFVQLARAKVQALVILPAGWFDRPMPGIIAAARDQRWPAVGVQPSIPALGGLFSYGSDAAALARRAAFYVDRILKGAKPGDLPIEQPTVFELVLNMKTAAALGIVIPPSMRLRATRLIE